MTHSTTVAKSGVCLKCRARYTTVICVEHLSDSKAEADTARFVCPKCGHLNSAEPMPGERIVSIETRLSSDLFPT